MKKIICTLSCVFSFGLTHLSSISAQTVWNDANGDWFTPANWTPAGPPTATDDAQVNNGGNASIAAGAATAQRLILGNDTMDSGGVTVSNASLSLFDLIVGFSGTGAMTIQNAGTVTTGLATIASLTGSSGSMTIDGMGSNLSTGPANIIVGDAGTATLTIQNKGTATSGFGFIGGASSTATVTGAGSAWNISNGMFVGETGTGTLNIQSGGVVTDLNGVIADNPGSTGIVNVNGAGSTWTNSSGLTVGNSGDATLSITTGGQVSDSIGEIAHAANSTGAVTVDGAGSKWTNSNNLFIGGDGAATLSITAGGVVSNFNGIIATGTAAGASGAVTVDGAGSKWTNSGYVFVGNTALGTLDVTSGGTVTSLSGSIGENIGGNGTATINGMGSTWTMTGDLNVGDNGNGTLNVNSGGTVSAGLIFIANGTGSTGVATIDGAGSVLKTTSAGMGIGISGNGTLNIKNGGLAMNAGNGQIGSQLGSVGIVNVDGAGSKWTNGGNIGVASNGDGTMNITNGGEVTNVEGYLGAGGFGNPVSGTATVDGMGSKWTNSSFLIIGQSNLATGTLHIQNGGLVTNTNATIGQDEGAVGSVTVDGAGSTWTNSGAVSVGLDGNGSLNITNGGTSSVASTARIAEHDSSTSSVTVDGTGSTWTLAGELDVARSGAGTLTIRNGGTVNMTGGARASIGANAFSTGTATVDGAGSTWTVGAGLFVGEGGNGALHIKNGGAVTNTFGQIGSQNGAVGTATIDGAGSTWTNNGTFLVGSDGTGMMTITNGGHVTSGSSQIGSGPTGNGTAIVEDFGSIWDPSSLFVGGDPMGPQGTGLLRIQNNGRVDAPITVWNTGTLEYGPNSIINGTLTFDGGTLRAIADASFTSDVTLAAGGVIIDSNGFSGQLTGAFTGAGGITKINNGRVEFTNISNYAGNTDINGGEFIVISEITTPQTNVNSGGLLGGIGTLHSNVFNSGVVSPGLTDLGTFTIDGDYTQNPAGTLRIGVGGLGMNEHGLLIMPNNHTASLDGTLQVLRENNFVPHDGDSFTILLATGGVTGEFANVTSTFPGVLRPVPVYNPTFVDLVFVLGSFVISSDLTPNQLAVAHELNEIAHDPLASDLIDFIENEPLADLPHEYDLIAPEELASMYETGFSQTLVQNMNLQHRMDDIRAGSTGFCGTAWQPHDSGKDYAFGKGEMAPTGAVLQPAPDNRWGVFATGSGNFVNVDGDSNAHGYDIATGSFTVGADYRIGSHFAIGVDGGYSSSNADLVDNGEMDVDGGRAGAYATVYGFKILGSNVHVDGAVGGGWNTYDTHRTGLQDIPVRGNTDGSQFNAMIAYGADWIFGCLDIGTWSTIQYTDVDIDGFTESGSLAPLHIEGQDEDSLVGTSGVRVAYDWHCGNMIVRPEIRAAWMHESNDRSYAIDSHLASGAGDTFTVHGPKIGRDAALVDAGVAVQLSSKISTYIYYDGVLGRGNYNNNSVSGGLRISF